MIYKVLQALRLYSSFSNATTTNRTKKEERFLHVPLLHASCSPPMNVAPSTTPPDTHVRQMNISGLQCEHTELGLQ